MTTRDTLNALMRECLDDAEQMLSNVLGSHFRTPEAVATVAAALFRARHLDEFGAARLQQWLQREEAVNEERLRKATGWREEER